MTLDEGIKHEEELTQRYEKQLKIYESPGEDYSNFFTVQKNIYKLCTEEHRRLAEWLKELKRLKEQEPETVTEFADRCKACGAKYGKLLKQYQAFADGEDCISRQAVIDALTKASGIRGDALKGLYDLSPVTPQPKIGHWIKHEHNGIGHIECSECLCWFLEADLLRNSYCPNCGAKMEVEK